MPDAAIADLIARSLPELTHPGDGKSGPIVLPLPMFRTSAMPREMAEQFAKDAGLPSPDIARLVAEAIVHVIESGNKTIVDNAELTQLRADAAAGLERHRQPQVCCSACHQPLFRINVDTDRPTISGPHFIETIGKLSVACPHTPVES
ncbi:hypothetical protein MSP7336_01814 [Mycobacterium shimoidei]|uniref:Uncharacterized protein n=1 Tax=Mycobacterium shimoidei TaxID=29313 RepID=A0A375YXU5_MYCSH|nr:hypothetical protein [Mycobacterium shimoidei]SRX93575.1 hypothetical protein MSP7336_01814 [Mycobacterium shimoidei]